MITNKQFDIPIYKGKFAVVFVDKKVAVEDLGYDDQKWGYKIDYAHQFHVGYNDKETFLIGFNLSNKIKINHGSIAHEILHAASDLLRRRGLKLSEKSEEAYTYLVGWMTNIVYEIINENKIKL